MCDNNHVDCIWKYNYNLKQLNSNYLTSTYINVKSLDLSITCRCTASHWGSFRCREQAPTHVGCRWHVLNFPPRCFRKEFQHIAQWYTCRLWSFLLLNDCGIVIWNIRNAKPRVTCCIICSIFNVATSESHQLFNVYNYK